MNPLLNLCRTIERSGRTIVKADFDKLYTPTTVTLHLNDDTSEILRIEADHQTFMKWWMETSRDHHRE